MCKNTESVSSGDHDNRYNDKSKLVVDYSLLIDGYDEDDEDLYQDKTSSMTDADSSSDSSQSSSDAVSMKTGGKVAKTMTNRTTKKTTSTSSSASMAGNLSTTTSNSTSKMILKPTHSVMKRNTSYDWYYFFGLLLFTPFTNVWPIYMIWLCRMVVVHIILSAHYVCVDKDVYTNKITQKQLHREKDDYLTAFIMHMYIQVLLQILFPNMFFIESSEITSCMKEILFGHVFFVEPIYYILHRWLHNPTIMKSMHGFHHLSIRTLPTTAYVQNYHEHILYVINFAPAFFLPYLYQGRNHYIAIGVYLIVVDILNTYGHSNIQFRSKYWNWYTSQYSPFKYLVYTPEFHQGHHAYFNKNYCLFMPIWDYIFGTAIEYQRKDIKPMLSNTKQDFIFIAHNGGLGTILNTPEICVYNVYDEYKTYYVPMHIEFMIANIICLVTRIFFDFYYCSRYCISNEYIGRIIVLIRNPIDYMYSKNYDSINEEIIKLIKQEYNANGTRLYGLGNLNKMKQLNDGGCTIVQMIQNDELLHDKNIRIWTGDTMTVASVYHQIIDIPDITEIYYIGAGGKVGTAVIELLCLHHAHIKIRIFSRNIVFDSTKYPNVSYSTNLSEVTNYKYVIIGKILSPKMYTNAFLNDNHTDDYIIKTRYMLDYTVPALTISCLKKLNVTIEHIRIGLLQTKMKNNPFLKGHYDVCQFHSENHIVPCHFGCILNTVNHRETNEVGDIDLNHVETLWNMTLSRGFHNVSIEYK